MRRCDQCIFSLFDCSHLACRKPLRHGALYAIQAQLKADRSIQQALATRPESDTAALEANTVPRG